MYAAEADTVLFSSAWIFHSHTEKVGLAGPLFKITVLNSLLLNPAF
jgi:hypothetical protein